MFKKTINDHAKLNIYYELLSLDVN